jgi:hypothetical protein
MGEGVRRRRRRPHLDPGGAVPLGRGPSPGAARRPPPLAERLATATDEVGELAPADDLPVLEELATAPIRSHGRVVYASNAVFLLELDAPDPAVAGQPMRAVYKPARGERPLWDFPRHTLHLRERAAYLLSAALQMRVVPPTVLRDGPHGPGSVQLYIHARDEPLAPREAAALEAQLRQLAAFDVLANNADRKRGHLLLDTAGHLWGIDNALTFLPYPRQRTVLLDLGGVDLAEDDAALVRRLSGGPGRGPLRRALRRLLSAAEVAAFEGRLDELAAAPWYPELDDWDGRPFEWW